MAAVAVAAVASCNGRVAGAEAGRARRRCLAVLLLLPLAASAVVVWCTAGSVTLTALAVDVRGVRTLEFLSATLRTASADAATTAADLFLSKSLLSFCSNSTSLLLLLTSGTVCSLAELDTAAGALAVAALNRTCLAESCSAAGARKSC
jgi:hypothetical protein